MLRECSARVLGLVPRQRTSFYVLYVVLLVVSGGLRTHLAAQSLFSGDIAGTVTDPSGAVIPNVAVTLRSLDTGAAQATTTNQVGAYRFTLLKPGQYRISVSASGFQRTERAITVEVGKIST